MPTAKISVIIPVYNAAPYVRQAVESALMQPQTGEIVLIEDASPDDSLLVCEELTAKYDKVRLLRHPNGENRGAGESRNLGIRESRYDIIAFLDADDFYLPDRFTEPLRIMAKTGADGVYESIEPHFESVATEERWNRARGRSEITGVATTMHEPIPPDQLFAALTNGKKGNFTLDGLVVRRDALMDVGMFPELRKGQDTSLLRKLAAVHTLMPGRISTPVTRYRVHDKNRVAGVDRPPADVRRWRKRVWLDVWQWGHNRLTSTQKNIMLHNLVGYMYAGIAKRGPFNRVLLALQARLHITHMLIQAPDLALHPRFWFCYVPNLRFIVYRLSRLWRHLQGKGNRH